MGFVIEKKGRTTQHHALARLSRPCWEIFFSSEVVKFRNATSSFSVGEIRSVLSISYGFLFRSYPGDEIGNPLVGSGFSKYRRGDSKKNQILRGLRRTFFSYWCYLLSECALIESCNLAVTKNVCRRICTEQIGCSSACQRNPFRSWIRNRKSKQTNKLEQTRTSFPLILSDSA